MPSGVLEFLSITVGYRASLMGEENLKLCLIAYTTLHFSASSWFFMSLKLLVNIYIYSIYYMCICVYTHTHTYIQTK